MWITKSRGYEGTPGDKQIRVGSLEEMRKEDDSTFCCAMRRPIRSQRYRKSVDLQGLAGDAEGGLDRLLGPCHTCTTSYLCTTYISKIILSRGHLVSSLSSFVERGGFELLVAHFGVSALKVPLG